MFDFEIWTHNAFCLCIVYTDILPFIALRLLLCGYCVFYKLKVCGNPAFWASLLAPFFQQHLLASCVCDHILVIPAIFQTSSLSFCYNDQWSFFFFLILFIYLFLAVLGLHFCARAFSSCGKWGPLFIAVRGPLTITVSLAAEHRLQTRRLSNCGSRAQLLRGMWDPPRPGLEPVSPALAGRFPTTAPPGKPMISDLWCYYCKKFMTHWRFRWWSAFFSNKIFLN